VKPNVSFGLKVFQIVVREKRILIILNFLMVLNRFLTQSTQLLNKLINLTNPINYSLPT